MIEFDVYSTIFIYVHAVYEITWSDFLVIKYMPAFWANQYPGHFRSPPFYRVFNDLPFKLGSSAFHCTSEINQYFTGFDNSTPI